MSVFTRNDKTSDTSATEAARPNGPPPVPDAKPAAAAGQRPSNGVATQGQGVSIISKALKITGNLESTEDIHIEGEVEGDVRGVSVRVGVGAKVKGTVYGDAVDLAGTIEGKIEAKKVVLTSTARMSGDIVHQDIKLESGAFFDGQCRPEFGKSESKNAPAIPKFVGAGQQAAPEKT